MNLANRLKTARESIGKSQKDMAPLCHASYRTWQGYEAGETQPNAKAFEALVKMGFNANWLLVGEGEMKREPANYPLAEGFKNGDASGEPNKGQAISEVITDQGQRFKLLRDIIDTYHRIKPETDPARISRDIVLIYRHFLDHYDPSFDEVEITEYIEDWL